MDGYSSGDRMQTENVNVVFDVDGVLYAKDESQDIFGTEYSGWYWRMLAKAYDEGLQVFIVTGRGVTNKEQVAQVLAQCEKEKVKAVVWPQPARFTGFEDYIAWKAGVIDLIDPVAVVDDMEIFHKPGQGKYAWLKYDGQRDNTRRERVRGYTTVPQPIDLFWGLYERQESYAYFLERLAKGSIKPHRNRQVTLINNANRDYSTWGRRFRDMLNYKRARKKMERVTGTKRAYYEEQALEELERA
jgi:hypothetical protein